MVRAIVGVSDSKLSLLLLLLLLLLPLDAVVSSDNDSGRKLVGAVGWLGGRVREAKKERRKQAKDKKAFATCDFLANNKSVL